MGGRTSNDGSLVEEVEGRALNQSDGDGTWVVGAGGPDDLEGRAGLEGLALGWAGDHIKVRGLGDDRRGGHKGGNNRGTHLKDVER